MAASPPPPPPPALINSLSGYTKFEDHLFEQYKLMVDTSQKLSDRRLSTNSYLFTINSSLVTVLGVLATLLKDRKMLAVIPAVGFLLAIAWMLLLTSFKRLNTAKFDVIHELETHLPARLFYMEWEYMKARRYRVMSDVERYIPILFLIFYAALFGFFIRSGPPKDALQVIRIESPVTVQMAAPVK
jgi:hypothetical protein